MYEMVIKKIDKSQAALGRNKVADDKDLYLAEVKRRLRQLDWILEKINQCLPRYKLAIHRLFAGCVRRRKKFKNVDVASLELTTLTESFYILAFRIVDILRKRKILGIKFSEPSGINQVRNNLIVHPGHDVLNFSFMVDPRKGPCLKNARIEGRRKNGSGEVTGHDPGLFPNAESLRQKIEEVFQ